MSHLNKRRVLLMRKKPIMKDTDIQTQETVPNLKTNSPKTFTYYDAFSLMNEYCDSAINQTLSNFSQSFNINSTPILPAVRSVSVTNNLKQRIYHRLQDDYSLDIDVFTAFKCEICKNMPCLCKKWKKIEDSYKLKITQNHFLTDIIKKKKESRPSSVFMQYAGSLNQGRRSQLNGRKRTRSKNSISMTELNDSINIKKYSKPVVSTNNPKHNTETIVIPQAQTESKTYERVLILLEKYMKATKSPEQIKEKLSKFYIYIKRYSNQKKNPPFSKKTETIAKFIARHREKLRLNPALIPLMDIKFVTARQLLMFDRFLCSLFRLVT